MSSSSRALMTTTMMHLTIPTNRAESALSKFSRVSGTRCSTPYKTLLAVHVSIHRYFQQTSTAIVTIFLLMASYTGPLDTESGVLPDEQTQQLQHQHTQPQPDEQCAQPQFRGLFRKLSILDRFLYIWILLVMVISIIFGYYVKEVKSKFQVAEISSVSLPIAIGLWVMMYPVLCKVQYEVLGKLLRRQGAARMIMLSLILNWIIGPALMTGLAWATLPDLPNFRTGVILVGIARCIAMVLVWNDLANGDSEYCAILVAINSIMQIVLFTPLSLFYLKVISRGSGLHFSAWDVAKSVLLFLGIPLVAGILTRFVMISLFGKTWYNQKFLPFIGPFALIGLLYTIFIMFSIQAHQILDNIVHVIRVAVPLLLYFILVFFSSLGICKWLKIPYKYSVTQCFTAASNNFELAIAVAIGSFGIDSQEALAATIGPLIEVPVLLLFVYIVSFLKHKFAN